MTKKKAIAFFESLGAFRELNIDDPKKPRWRIYLRGKFVCSNELQLMYFLRHDVVAMVLAESCFDDSHLKCIGSMKELELLDLNDTLITDAVIPELAKLKRLECLTIYRTRITELGAETLEELLPNCDVLYQTSMTYKQFLDATGGRKNR